MLMKSKMKKLVSLLTFVFMLASFTSVYADVVADGDINVYNFESAGATVSGNKVKDSDGVEKFTLSNEKNFTVLVDSDTLILSRTVNGTRNIYTDGFSYPSEKNLVIKTAVKRSKANGCISNITINSTENHYIVPFQFGNDGKIYINGATTSELEYAANTWYEVTIEYSASTLISKVTIDGGTYENISFYGYNVGNLSSPPTINRVRIGFISDTKADKGDLYLDYLNIGYNDDVKNKTVFNKVIDFEDEAYTIDSTWRSHAYSQSNTQNYFYNGTAYNINGGSAEDLVIAQLDEEHGKSLKLTRNGKSTQLRHPMAAPFSRNVTDGVLVFEYAICGDEGTATNPKVVDYYVDSSGATLSGVADTIGKGVIVVGDNDGIITANKWHKVVAVVDIDAGTYDMYAYEEYNPSAEKNIATGNLLGTNDERFFGGISSLQFYIGQSEGNYTPDSENSDYLYLDDIAIYTSADLAVEDVLSVDSGASKSSLNTPVVTVFNAPIKSADVKLYCNGAEVAATKTIVGKTVSVIPATGVFDAESKYQLVITDATDVFDNKLSHTVDFTTGDKVNVTYNLDGTGLSVEFSSNIGEVSLMFGVATYSKASNELLTLDFYSDDSIAEYSKNVVLSSDTNHYSKLFVWDGNQTPYIDAVTFGK